VDAAIPSEGQRWRCAVRKTDKVPREVAVSKRRTIAGIKRDIGRAEARIATATKAQKAEDKRHVKATATIRATREAAESALDALLKEASALREATLAAFDGVAP